MRTIADALTALPSSPEVSHVLQIFTEKRVCGCGMLLFFPPWCCAVLLEWEWMLMGDK